jgi:hypothetical protein
MNASVKDHVGDTAPVRDSVARVNHEVAVGEDLAFQRSWWKFERIIWMVFILIIVADLAGVFGRGPLAHAAMGASTDPVAVQYERVERTGTPSMMTVTLRPEAVHDGIARLYVSDSVVSGLGAQRIVPQPATTTIGHDGLTYTFPMSAFHGVIRFELEPSSAGRYTFTVGTPGTPSLTGSVIVVP